MMYSNKLLALLEYIFKMLLIQKQHCYYPVFTIDKYRQVLKAVVSLHL